MSAQNIPPPPRYPSESAEPSDSNISKENSVMENSVIYISDGGSPNYKSGRNNGYPHCNNQILPNLVHAINSTYQNLPPKSPKSNYRNMLNNIESSQKNNQWRQGEMHNEPVTQPYRQPEIFNEHTSHQYRQMPNMAFNKNNQQYWIARPGEDVDEDNGCRERHEAINSANVKTRSHPNLMNDYVNLAGTETILNDILYNRSNRPYVPATNDSNKACIFKPYQMNQEQFSNVLGTGPSSPEMVRNGLQMYPQSLNEYVNNPENFSSESSRLVNLLLEENKRLRSKLRQSDSRLESVDHLERKIYNLEILFEELLTSQRRQRLLDLQLQQASLTNYIVKNVSQNDVAANNAGCATSSSDNNNNRPIDLRKTASSTIQSSPVITQKLNSDSPGERSILFGSKQQKNDITKRNCSEQERYLIENECSESWIEQTHISPVLESEPQAHLQKTADDDLCVKLKQTIKSVNIATSPYFSRVSENQSPLINSPTELFGRKMMMSPITGGPSRNWLVHQSSTPPSYRIRMSQQPNICNINNYRFTNSPKATSVMNLTNS